MIKQHFKYKQIESSKNLNVKKNFYLLSKYNRRKPYDETFFLTRIKKIF